MSHNPSKLTLALLTLGVAVALTLSVQALAQDRAKSKPFDAAMADEAEAVIRGRLIEYQGGSKWHFQTIEVIEVYKNKTNRVLKGGISVGNVFYGGDVPSGVMTLYLQPYGDGWALLTGTTSRGISHARQTTNPDRSLTDPGKAANAQVVIRGTVSRGSDLHQNGQHHQTVTLKAILKNDTPFYIGDLLEVGHSGSAPCLPPGESTLYLTRKGTRWTLAGGSHTLGSTSQRASREVREPSK